MNQTKLLLGVGLIGLAGYMIWKNQSHKNDMRDGLPNKEKNKASRIDTLFSDLLYTIEHPFPSKINCPKYIDCMPTVGGMAEQDSWCTKGIPAECKGITTRTD